MIALDTNILARYVFQDDPAQTEAVEVFIAGLSADNPGYVCREVLVELVWLLERAVRFGRSDVARVVQTLLESRELAFEAAERVSIALSRYILGGPGFADQMILLAANDAGVSLATFDRELARRSGAQLVAP